MKPDLKAVIFDMDGTLADTFPLIVAAWNAALHEPMQREFGADEVVSRFGVPDAAMLARELQGHPQPVIEAAIEKYFGHYRAAHDLVRTFEGIPEMLKNLRERHIPMGLMTGKGRRAADISLEALGWTCYFGSVVTGDDVTAQKPHPEGVLRVAHELGIAPEHCAYVGDSPADIGAGRAAGMYTVAAGWHPYYADALTTERPHTWADSPQEIPMLFD